MGGKVKVEKEQEKFEAIAKALKDLRFGELQITIHEGKIVQINRIDKQRFTL